MISTSHLKSIDMNLTLTRTLVAAVDTDPGVDDVLALLVMSCPGVTCRA